MIKYADSVWAGAGSDSVIGVGPAPDYRESQTTSREYFVMSALDEILVTPKRHPVLRYCSL